MPKKTVHGLREWPAQDGSECQVLYQALGTSEAVAAESLEIVHPLEISGHTHVSVCVQECAPQGEG